MVFHWDVSMNEKIKQIFSFLCLSQMQTCGMNWEVPFSFSFLEGLITVIYRNTGLSLYTYAFL